MIHKRILRISSGFTLIELLIVIAIIGVLSALLMANFIGVRQRARDAQRKSDIRQIQSALELYRSDVGAYPIVAGTSLNTTAPCPTPSAFTYSGGGQTSTYMTTIPCDPLGNTNYYNGGNYYYWSDGTSYLLVACLENATDSQGGATFSVSIDNNNTKTQTDVDSSSVCTKSNGVYYVKTNP